MKQAEDSQKRRRTLIVDRVQRILVIQILRDWLIMLLVTFLLTAIWQIVTVGPFGSWQEILQSTWNRFGPVFTCLLCVIPVVARRTCTISNRTAGPLVRISRAMQALTSGEEVTPVTLRDGDFGQELAADFNRLAKAVAAKGSQELVFEGDESSEAQSAHPEAVMN